MGRTPTRNKYLPPGMRARHRGSKTYYFLDTGAKPRKEIPLGQDYVEAVQKWGVLTSSSEAAGIKATFRHVAERYQRDVLPTKAAGTQEINLRELSSLYKFFDAPPVALEEIEPVNVRRYLDWRAESALAEAKAKNAERAKCGKPEKKITGREGQVPANREKALLSHIWNYARGKGLTEKANPCAGIKGFPELGRDTYIDDDILAAVWEVAERPLRDALDLAYLTGQRPADVLKLSRADLRDGAMTVVQNKTGARLRVEVIGEFAAVMARIDARKVSGLTLICDDDGRRMTKAMLRGAFDRARIAAAEARPELSERIAAFQFRDLRAKAGTDTEELRGMAAAKDQLGHSSETMTSHYVRHRLGKLVKPTK
jgi:integrase